MLVGQIYLWDTDKAKGHASRDKYHLYIGECQWEDGHAFLFINKSDYGGDFALLKKTYDFFPLCAAETYERKSNDLTIIWKLFER